MSLTPQIPTIVITITNLVSPEPRNAPIITKFEAIMGCTTAIIRKHITANPMTARSLVYRPTRGCASAKSIRPAVPINSMATNRAMRPNLLARSGLSAPSPCPTRVVAAIANPIPGVKESPSMLMAIKCAA